MFVATSGSMTVAKPPIGGALTWQATATPSRVRHGLGGTWCCPTVTAWVALGAASVRHGLGGTWCCPASATDARVILGRMTARRPTEPGFAGAGTPPALSGLEP